uniref:Endomucin n=1 Tax=Cebus imitator TaxID=2715852 RepID=A0A2K5QJ27_CEBIM
MELLQVTILFLLPSLCSSDVDTGLINANISSPSVTTTIKTSAQTPSTESLQNPVTTPTIGTIPTGTTNSELLKKSLLTVASLTTSTEELRITTTDGRENESIISNVAVTNLALPNAVSTSQSSQHKTETQSTIKIMKIPGTAENGNDQPQSDKESVKLLTVKTISHESGEHSAQGKTKN